MPEGPTYLSARSLSPSSPSAIPSRLRPTSRPMAREPAARPPGWVALWAVPASAQGPGALRPVSGLGRLPALGAAAPPSARPWAFVTRAYLPRHPPWDPGRAPTPSLGKGPGTEVLPFLSQTNDPQETQAARTPFSFPSSSKTDLTPYPRKKLESSFKDSL